MTNHPSVGLTSNTGWRGRRFNACRLVGELQDTIEQLGIDDGKDPPPESGLPVVSESQRNELHNLASVLLRMILSTNDGHMSITKLRTF